MPQEARQSKGDHNDNTPEAATDLSILEKATFRLKNLNKHSGRHTDSHDNKETGDIETNSDSDGHSDSSDQPTKTVTRKRKMKGNNKSKKTMGGHTPRSHPRLRVMKLIYGDYIRLVNAFPKDDERKIAGAAAFKAAGLEVLNDPSSKKGTLLSSYT